jgi:serine/threonine protein kinase
VSGESPPSKTSAPVRAEVTPAAPAAGRPLLARNEILDDSYRIVEVLATGGMGEVYRAVHLRLPRPLAIKTLHPEFAARQERVARFCREACVLAQLRHPNIVQVLDFNVSPSGVPYLAMELIDGQDLRAALDQGRRFDAAEVTSIVRQVASALDAAHAAGVIHRDLKPENVVLVPAPGQRPVVKVIDFGLSLPEGGGRLTGDRAIFGTPDYMAPEQAQGLREQIDGRTDQFALAALAHTLLTGETPFWRETPVAILYAVVHEDPAGIPTATSWKTRPVERVLARGMARDRDDRYRSVLAFADAFEEALIEGGALPRPTTPEPLRIVQGGRTSTTFELPMLLPPILRRGLPALFISLAVAGALWGGSGAAAARPAWKAGVSIGGVRESISTGWQAVKDAINESRSETMREEGSQR